VLKPIQEKGMTWTKEDDLAARRNWYRKNQKHEYNRIKNRLIELKIWFRELKSSTGCTQCSENHWACLEYHHLDSKTKDREVSRMVSDGMGRERILAEMTKCVILCSNCHRKLHADE
jgi:hypothetical protein